MTARETVNRCPYCRVELDENGVTVSKGDRHAPDCADRPLEKSELKKLFAYRDRSTSATEWSPWVPVGQDLLTVLADDDIAKPVVALLSELAALSEMADANYSTPTDRMRRANGDGIPSFDPAAAERELKAASHRIRAEYEKLAGVVRNPHRSPEPQCVQCSRRASEVDSYCKPCGARILRDHRRGS